MFQRFLSVPGDFRDKVDLWMGVTLCSFRSLINSRIRSSRSHESLLTNSVTMHSIDLTSSNIEIKPLHSSILGQDHCFQVSTSHGSKYISCRTAEEREKWIGSLRKTIQPNAENIRRVDNSLKLWIKEAKNCSSKKRYFCEIFLDKTLYARTSSKTNSDMLFWGEHFEFNNLPSVQLVTINLFREADKKKKKDKNTLVGLHVVLVLWYLSNEYTTLCEVMEGMVGVRDKEDIATTLVHIMQRLNKAKDFLSDVIMAEIVKNENQNLTFRGNTIGTKAMEAYMKLVGEKYLQDTLGDFVKTMIDSEDDCEVDPTKIANPQVLQNHQRFELRDVFSSFRSRCKQYHRDDTADNLISACIFLRFLCPSILSPSLFNLTQEYPHEKAVRGLTLIAKTIQTLANLTKFGGKEEFMTFMNEFLERQSSTMSTFLKQISSTEGNNQFLEFDGYIDLGKELSILHTLLTENLVKADMESLKKLGRLNSILGNITESLNNPENDRKKVQNNRKSQIYDNLVNVPHSQMSTSPTEIFRDLLRHCGEEDIPVLSGRRVTKQGSFDVGSSRHAASNLNTNDDYVNFNAVGSSSSGESREVGNVSVTSHVVSNEHHVNQSWSEIVTAADTNHGDYIDLMNFIDDDAQNSSMELEQNMNGSQMSISQISTIASSGYQSFGYSQSSSPIDAMAQEINQDFSKSPSMIHTLQPLSFSNPMYRHNQGSNSSRSVGASPMHQGSTSSGSLSSEEESSTVKHRSPIKSEAYRTSDPLRNLAPKLSSSSSSESLHELDKSVLETPPRPARCSRSMSASGEPVKFTLGLHGSCSSHTFEDMHNSNLSNSHSHSYSLSRAPSRPGELTHAGSVDFTYLNKKYGGDHLRRTATDSKISQSSTCSPIHIHSDSGVSVSSNRGQMSPEESPAHRRLSPSNAVHMGIRSVQRKIYDQEKTKQEYEQEVSILKQQLVEAQKNLAEAELRLKEHESGTHQVVEDWQCRLEESEERMRKQQAEKDGQMKHIIQRLMTVEEDLRHDQQDMQKLVHQKQKVIEAQERRIQTLDSANAKLLTALNELRDRYTVTQQSRNGMLGPLRSKVNQSQFAEFKTSSC
ncbi:hypothetical protein KUTeg_001168 [Tegillarca granosa]|uniref:Ras GTPase-activating protein nGAP n=1 Tax=Tegillarca granosa TaxID=220873 RepID=A0ABQ9FYI9_TEGGR|nr:hypothetical protein KUTeg_001168 [Tegillarca granosa]